MKRTPYDNAIEYPLLVCQKCGHTILDPIRPINWPEEQWLWQPDRFHNLVRHNIAKHICPKPEKTAQDFIDEMDAYNTIMANQTYLDEIEIKPAPIP